MNRYPFDFDGVNWSISLACGCFFHFGKGIQSADQSGERKTVSAILQLKRRTPNKAHLPKIVYFLFK
jgi:hypothetical protein